MAPGQEWPWPLFRRLSQGTEPALGALVGTGGHTGPRPLREPAGDSTAHLPAPGSGMELPSRELLGGAQGSQGSAFLISGNASKAQLSSKALSTLWRRCPAGRRRTGLSPALSPALLRCGVTQAGAHPGARTLHVLNKRRAVPAP